MDIHATTAVGPLLEAHPELEEVLIGLSPAFARLKNPVLRATLGRFATLDHAAKVSGVPLPRLVQTLRAAVGQTEEAPPPEDPMSLTGDHWPDWVETARMVETLDVSALLAGGKHPLANVRQTLGVHPVGAIVCLRSPFPPAPLLDHAREEGWQAAVIREGDGYLTALRRI